MDENKELKQETGSEDFEIILGDEETEGAEDASSENPEPETAPEETPSEQTEEQEKGQKTVPVSAVARERERVRLLKKENADMKKVLSRIMEGAGAQSPQDLEARMDDLTLRQFIDHQGMDENTARLFMEQQKKLREYEAAQNENTYRDELSALRDNEYYSDIDEVQDEVLEYAKNKKVSVKEAYNALYGEQRALAMKREGVLDKADAEKKNKKIAALSSGGNVSDVSPKIKITREEAEFADAAGISYADYLKNKSR